ncbi:hypothetical protein N7532_011487 [Penicillium argentinense]|uniref:Nucleolar 27S pre-rRNA processing Urb2/Npa2 C-terminal domain-containing protein n=1 Tax=Penicillium argentinense TaxID=1131581 RepID=A0A9W9EIM0_9EURO|nr:uncharacterized protein N7532_011487 [Penicillium argentinense]KAJ5082444.1 hypothetical protein N7532_011487 [Penicillium argentinense]
MEQPPSSSQEALLRLEKGSDAPTTQLHNAAQILGVDLKLCESHPETHRIAQAQGKAAPKEEWVLRWLLKKLRNGKNFRVDPNSFLLLRQVIDRVSARNLATILKDQRFLSVLCDTVADLEADISVTSGGGVPISSPESDSSQTLASSPPANDGRGSHGTKRKRNEGNDTDAMDLDEQPQNPASCFLTFIRALDCLYGIVTLTQLTLTSDENAHSLLKLALRGEPEVVARLLGQSFQLSAVAITQFSHARKTTDLQHMLYVLPAMLEMWELRSYGQDDKDHKASNDCFAQSCFAYALRLQLCLRSIKLDTDERAHLLHSIERILAVHVLLPARAAFYARGGTGIDYSKESNPNWNCVQPVTDTFRPIIRELSMTPQAESNGNHESACAAWKSIELLPELFDNAVRAVPRYDFRRQTVEVPWLETLFVSVAELAYDATKDDEPECYSSRFVSVLEQLLRVALDRDVGLTLHTILTHTRYTGLFHKGLKGVEWDVTALMISLGVDVFMPNSGLRDSRMLLDALLDKIMLQWRENDSKKDEYKLVKNNIVIPLLRGFATARDLPTFMEVWHNQLIILEEARSRNADLPYFSVWEDDDLCDTYSDLMKTSPTASNVAAQMHTAAETIRDSNGKVSESSQSYAKFVIMEASFREKALDFPESETVLSSFLEFLRATLSSKQVLHWRWRLWRFLLNVFQNKLESADSPFAQATNSLVEIASKVIQRNHKKHKDIPLAHLESWEAYRFVLAAIKDKPTKEQLETFAVISDKVTDFVVSISPDDAQKSMKAPWNGRVETLRSSANLAFAYILANQRAPQIWKQIKAETRSRLFEHLLSLAAAQYRPSQLPLEATSDDARFLQMWASMVCHEYLLGVQVIVPDLALLLNKSIENESPNRRLCMESLQRIPASSITRGLRTVLLDKLHNVILQQDSSPEVTVGLLTMMAKLAAMPKSDAAVTGDWEPIWTAARAITLEGTELDLQIMKSFRRLHRAIISKLLVLSEDERVKSFKTLFARVSKQSSKLRQIDRDSMACFLLRLSLSELWVHRSKLHKAYSEDELASCRQRVFGLVLAEMKSVKDQCRKQKLEETITLIKTIDALEDFEDMAQNNIEVEKFLTKIEHYMEMSVDSGPSRLIRRRLLATKGPEKSITEPVLRAAETLTLRSLYAEDQQLFIRATTERFRSMPAELSGKIIQELCVSGLREENSGYRLLVVYLAVASISGVEDKENAVARELSSLSTTLAETIVQCTSVEQFCFATECLTLLLRVHSRCLSQSNIDSILASITAAASSDGPHISPKYAPTIFSRLCRLLGTVLGLQRIKIGGRFHLVNNAMGRLLGCLFARSRKRPRSARVKSSISQPFWLAQLDVFHATHFTRLLTTLCDPTLSAVLRVQPGSSREALTDETKKVKSIAGQYLKYIVMKYAQNSLQGALVPNIKDALMPGFYAVLDVMSKETLRSLNSQLDVSARAVFKSLYDDYVKFGKWNMA